MPALDYINKTAETTADISAAAELATVAVENSRAGFDLGEGFTAVITEGSTANFNTGLTRTLNIYLDVSVDNGTTYYPIGVAPMNISAAGVPLQMKWASCNMDIIPENYVPANIQWRGRANWTNVLASTDDFNFQIYLGNQNTGVMPGLSGNGIS